MDIPSLVDKLSLSFKFINPTLLSGITDHIGGVEDEN